MLCRFCLTILLSIAANFALAADAPINSYKERGAIRGADAVAYFSLEPGAPAVIGKKAFTYEWKGAKWRFANEQNMKKFSENPERYAPQYGGYCAFSVAHNFTTSIRPNNWAIIDDKLYLNYNKRSLKKFLKKPKKKIARANINWPEVLKKCEKRNNCQK